MYKCICNSITEEKWKSLVKERGFDEAKKILEQGCGICLEKEDLEVSEND